MLKIKTGTKVMLAVDIDIQDCLMNSSTGNITQYPQVIVTKVHAKFSDQETGLKTMRPFHLVKQILVSILKMWNWDSNKEMIKIFIHQTYLITFNTIQDRGSGVGGGVGQKSPTPTSFSPITSTNVRISPQNFLTVSFIPFDRLV